MSNEEKILELLAKHEDTFAQINQTLVEMRADLSEVKTEQAEMKATINEIDQRSIRTQVLLETDYADKLQLLFDGHATILETLAPKSRVEALEEDVDTLKTVMRLLTHDVAELKKAQ